MANTIPTSDHPAPSLPARIPRYIGNLNALAVQAGLAVSMSAGEARTISKWRGPREAFLALVQPVKSYRLPQHCGTLSIPGGSVYYGPRALVQGSVWVTGDEVLFVIDFGPSAFEISDAAGLEIVSYADEILYHGTPEDLLAFGIDRARLPLGKRAARMQDYKWEGEKWTSRRQPDGAVLYRIESPGAFRRRRAELTQWIREYAERQQPGCADIETQPKVRPSYLRLVVDNDAGAPP